METLKGFPNPPAMVRVERSSPLPTRWQWEPWEGFPNPPALWLRRAKPASANAIMGTPKEKLNNTRE
jgi:hypothetical protein